VLAAQAAQQEAESMAQRRHLFVQRTVVAVAVVRQQTPARILLVRVVALVAVLAPTSQELTVLASLVKATQVESLRQTLVVVVVVLAAQEVTHQVAQVVLAVRQAPMTTQVHLSLIRVAAAAAVRQAALLAQTLVAVALVQVEVTQLRIVAAAVVEVLALRLVLTAAQVVSCFVRSPQTSVSSR
jgi:hypothetical protein